MHAGAQMTGEHAAAGQLAVSLLRTCPLRPRTCITSEGAMTRLHHLAGLLDNYLHPSNTGAWCVTDNSTLSFCYGSIGACVEACNV